MVHDVLYVHSMILYDQNFYTETRQYRIDDVIDTTLLTVIRPQYWGSSIHSVIIVGHWYVTSLYPLLEYIYCT